MCILEPCGAAIKNAASLPAKEGTIFQVRNYVIKRILLSFVILFCVTFIIYVMMRSLPSSFAENMAMQLSRHRAQNRIRNGWISSTQPMVWIRASCPVS